MASERLKIVVDDKGRTKVWIDGEEGLGITKIKFECEANAFPIIEIGLSPLVRNSGGKKNEQ